MTIFGFTITRANKPTVSKRTSLHIRHKRVCEAKVKLEEAAHRKSIGNYHFDSLNKR